MSRPVGVIGVMSTVQTCGGGRSAESNDVQCIGRGKGPPKGRLQGCFKRIRFPTAGLTPSWMGVFAYYVSLFSKTTCRSRVNAEYREVVERRVYTVTGQHADEEQIEKMIETGESETIFQKAILEQVRLAGQFFFWAACRHGWGRRGRCTKVGIIGCSSSLYADV